MEYNPKRRRVSRKLMFSALMLVGTLALIEATSFVATELFLGSSKRLVEQRCQAAMQNPFAPGGKFTAPAVMHPYIGAVMEPRDDGRKFDNDERLRVTEYGFSDSGPPIHHRSKDVVIVGILGGSVARQFSQNATDSLADKLSKVSQFAGKKFQFVRLASNGYKQPQQLMTINYVCTLGGDFDILINLDGFNEAALPSIDNVPFGVFAAYPRDWGKMVAAASSPEFTRMTGYISYLRVLQRDEAIQFGSFPWNCSPTALLIWSTRKNHSDHAIVLQMHEISRLTQKESTYCGSGPPEHFDSDQAMYEHCANLWFRSSVLLHQLCAARKIRYFHFLQPNQYVAGTKPIGDVEAATAIEEGSKISVAVRQCYPILQAMGPRLVEAGVDFTDLTQVFADHPEPIYNDSCCHVEVVGDLILAKAIASRIAHALSNPVVHENSN